MFPSQPRRKGRKLEGRTKGESVALTWYPKTWSFIRLCWISGEAEDNVSKTCPHVAWERKERTYLGEVVTGNEKDNAKKGLRTWPRTGRGSDLTMGAGTNTDTACGFKIHVTESPPIVRQPCFPIKKKHLYSQSFR